MLKSANAERDVLTEALEGQPGSAYDEGAFQYFLSIERARANRSKQNLRVLLATLEPEPGQPAAIDPTAASSLFAGLRVSLRDTDVIGWYRQHKVAGAVLSERQDMPADEHAEVIIQRVGDSLQDQLPSSVVGALRVRVVLLPKRFGTA